MLAGVDLVDDRVQLRRFINPAHVDMRIVTGSCAATSVALSANSASKSTKIALWDTLNTSELMMNRDVFGYGV